MPNNFHNSDCNSVQTCFPEEDNWQAIRETIRGAIGERDFRSWLYPLYLFSSSIDRVTLAAPSRFVRDWVQANYMEALLKGWVKLNPQILLVEVVVRAPRPGQKKKLTTTDIKNLRQTETAAHGNIFSSFPAARKETGLVENIQKDKDFPTDFTIDYLASPLDPTYTLSSFIVAPPNELAVAAIKRVLDNQSPTFNPLVIYGDVGLGKTHLLQALARAVKETVSNRRVGYISAEKFLYSFVRSIRSRSTEQFKNAMRDLDVLLIDDMQYISSGTTTQEEFVQTFNTLFDRNKQVVVAVNKPPALLEQLDERLRSRLMGGLTVDLQPTTEDLRLSVLHRKTANLTHLISTDVLTFVAENITSNIRELEGAINRIIAHATLMKRPVSPDLARSILSDLLVQKENRISIEGIQKQVAKYFEVRPADMVSKRRARQVTRPRQVAMYLSKQLTSRSLPEIGRRFGGRDHTTVMHAIKRVDELCQLDGQFSEDISKITLTIKGAF